jgi:hypothetical protein
MPDAVLCLIRTFFNKLLKTRAKYRLRTKISNAVRIFGTDATICAARIERYSCIKFTPKS